jgi:[ribosomal protein S18]-alanine N-acetyltransferase
VTRPAPRPFGSADVEAVAELERAVFGDPWSKRAFHEILALDHVRGFVVDGARGAADGYAFCSAVADEGEILNLAVAPTHRRRGLGKALLHTCLAWMAERGAATAYLEVRRSNEAAIAMYGAEGFATVGVRPNYYRRPTEDAVTMSLGLAARTARK